MAFFAADRIKVSTATIGTDDFGLGSAASAAFQDFDAAGVPDGATVHYSAYTTSEFECGEGVYDAGGPTLSRDTIFASSNGGAIEDFGSSPTVVVSPLAETYRTRLTEDTTYYVRKDGDDTNTGLADSAGGAFATIAHALNVVSKLDVNGYKLIVQVGNATSGAPWAEIITLPRITGIGATYSVYDPTTWPELRGDPTTPTNVWIIYNSHVSGSSTTIRNGDVAGQWIINGFAMSSSNGSNISSGHGGLLLVKNMHFGVNFDFDLQTGAAGTIIVNGTITIAGNRPFHLSGVGPGYISYWPDSLVLSGTPNFTGAFTYIEEGMVQEGDGTLNITGSATGKYFNLEGASLRLWTLTPTQALTALPGSIAGTGTGFINGELFVDGSLGLDDYEEGTWSPTYTTSGTNFSSVTYDAGRGGVYVKIGDLVYISGFLWTDGITVGSASGTVRIGNLPFVPVTQGGGAFGGTGGITIGRATAFTGEEPLSAEVIEGTAALSLYYRSAVDGETTGTAVADLGTGSDDNIMSFGGCYRSV
jgi:hypothetical protein